MADYELAIVRRDKSAERRLRDAAGYQLYFVTGKAAWRHGVIARASALLEIAINVRRLHPDEVLLQSAMGVDPGLDIAGIAAP